MFTLCVVFIELFLNLLAGDGFRGRGRRWSPLPRSSIQKPSSRFLRSQKSSWLHSASLAPRCETGFAVRTPPETDSPAVFQVVVSAGVDFLAFQGLDETFAGRIVI